MKRGSPADFNESFEHVLGLPTEVNGASTWSLDRACVGGGGALIYLESLEVRRATPLSLQRAGPAEFHTPSLAPHRSEESGLPSSGGDRCSRQASRPLCGRSGRLGELALGLPGAQCLVFPLPWDSDLDLRETWFWRQRAPPEVAARCLLCRLSGAYYNVQPSCFQWEQRAKIPAVACTSHLSWR